MIAGRSMVAILATTLLASSAASIASPATVLHASLSGRAEVPGPGKRDASGSATIRILPPKRICYEVRIRHVPNATMAHIHEGRAGRSGAPVLPLKKGVGDARSFEGCSLASRALQYQLANHPRRFYVNVHSTAFPNGAIRGQLHR